MLTNRYNLKCELFGHPPSLPYQISYIRLCIGIYIYIIYSVFFTPSLSLSSLFTSAMDYNTNANNYTMRARRSPYRRRSPYCRRSVSVPVSFFFLPVSLSRDDSLSFLPISLCARTPLKTATRLSPPRSGFAKAFVRAFFFSRAMTKSTHFSEPTICSSPHSLTPDFQTLKCVWNTLKSIHWHNSLPIHSIVYIIWNKRLIWKNTLCNFTIKLEASSSASIFC